MNKCGYRYQFSGPYLQCPHCGRDKKYRNIYDMVTGLPVADGECGACFVCDFDVNAHQYFQQHPGTSPNTHISTHALIPPKEVSYIPRNYVTDNMLTSPLRGQANLTDYLLNIIDESLLMPVLQKYGVGKDGNGAVLWPQIDSDYNVREIKVQWHDSASGKRKGGYTYLMHKQLRNSGILDPDTDHEQCLFGLHLLANATKETICCIVESEKTALVCSVIAPDYVWLATGSESNFNMIYKSRIQLARCKAVVVYPDAGSKNYWQEIARKSVLRNMIFSDMCAGHPHNTDLADLLIYDWLTYQKKIEPYQVEKESIQDVAQERPLVTAEPIPAQNTVQETKAMGLATLDSEFQEPKPKAICRRNCSLFDTFNTYEYDWLTQELWDNYLSPEAILAYRNK